MLQELNQTKQVFHTNTISPGANSVLYVSNKDRRDRTKRGPNAFDYENTM